MLKPPKNQKYRETIPKFTIYHLVFLQFGRKMGLKIEPANEKLQNIRKQMSDWEWKL